MRSEILFVHRTRQRTLPIVPRILLEDLVDLVFRTRMLAVLLAVLLEEIPAVLRHLLDIHTVSHHPIHPTVMDHRLRRLRALRALVPASDRPPTAPLQPSLAEVLQQLGTTMANSVADAILHARDAQSPTPHPLPRESEPKGNPPSELGRRRKLS